MLTEKKILKSSSKDYMSEQQLAFFKHRLESLRSQVMDNLASFRNIIAANEIEPDPLDTACTEELKQITYIGLKRDTELLHQIENFWTVYTIMSMGSAKKQANLSELHDYLQTPTQHCQPKHSIRLKKNSVSKDILISTKTASIRNHLNNNCNSHRQNTTCGFATIHKIYHQTTVILGRV